MPSAQEVTDAYLRLAAAGDRGEALALALRWAEEHSPASAIADIVVPSQVEIGWRWQTALWSVADEHVATGVSDFVLAVLADRYRVPVRRDGAIAVVCAEGEWHSLAARIVAELLRLEGWRVQTLGASTPAADLSDHLLGADTMAVAAHCSMASNLPGLMRTIDAAHSHGVPVIVGGRALTKYRATRVGADAIDGQDNAMFDVLEQWAGQPPEMPPSDSDLSVAPDSRREYFKLESHRSELVDGAMLAVLSRHPDLARLDPGQIRMVHDQLAQIMRFLAASLLVDDRSIILDAFSWLDTVCRSRDLPAAMVNAFSGGLLDSLATLDLEMPEAHAALAEAAEKAED